MIRLVHGAATHLGLVRRQNEDSFVATDGLYAVCDGMGGARAGEVASEAACRILVGLPREAGPEDLRRAVSEANSTIRERSLADKALAGMGTTMTAASARGSLLTLAQVGDSRAYLWRRGSLRQVTDDHSLVAEMIRRGQLTPEQAAVHPHRSIITRALGTEPSVSPDVFDLSLEPGDRVVLCSDGLSGMVPHHELTRLVGTGTSPQQVADDLIAAALRHGGEDNVTVVVIFAVEDEDGTGRSIDPGDDTVEVTLAPRGRRHDPAHVQDDRPAPASHDDPTPTAAVPLPAAVLDDPSLTSVTPLAVSTREDPSEPSRDAPDPAPPDPGDGRRPRAGASSAGSVIDGDETAEASPALVPTIGSDGFGPVVRTPAGAAPARRGPSRRVVLIGLAVVVAVLAVAVGGFLAFNSTVYFVGTTDGNVALFQGLPYAVVGFELYSEVTVAPVRFDALDTYVQARVDAHELVTKEEGLHFIRGLATSQ